jgi:hypothetical protein
MKNLTATKLYTFAFGLFLGLCLWKFGNPVILDHRIIAPASASEMLSEPWPTHWANWILLPLAMVGGLFIFKNRNPKYSEKSEIGNRKSEMKWLWWLPLIWLGWQFVSATETVDANLTSATLWQFCGCVACYFLGALLFAGENTWRWLLPGLLAAFVFCLVRGVDQRMYEFPQNHQLLIEGEQNGWTNFPPESVAEMKTQGIIISTNGAEVANPLMLAKFAKGRVYGTLVYPNALAGIILLLLPLSLAAALGMNMKRPIHLALIGLAIFLGGEVFFWTGSKLGWLIGIGMGGLLMLRLNWPRKFKLLAVAVVLILGLGTFSIRFYHYFAAGATSASARLDYWRAAVQTTASNPVFGTGPGTFQRPYAAIKSSESEMARLTHNDYLEQFSDSGVPAGLAYLIWISLALTRLFKTIWSSDDFIPVAMLMGLLGWFLQGLGEFSLYIPALAWTAFTLLGCLIGQKINQFDK